MTASPATADVHVAVVLLTVNQREATRRCLESLAEIRDPPIRVVVWDNGSVDGTLELISRDFPDVTVSRSAENLGAAAGRNAGAALALRTNRVSHLLFLDNDTVVTPDLVRRLVDPTLIERDVAQTAPKILSLSDPRRIDMAGGARISFWRGETTGIGLGELDHGQYDQPFDCVAGGCTLVTVEAFREVGGFDTDFDPYGYEDMDLSLRILEAGYRCLYVPEAVLYHAVTQTLEGGRYTPRYARFKSRNWLLFLWRHGGWHDRWAFLLVGAPRLLARRLARGEAALGRGLLRGAADFWRMARGRWWRSR